MAEGGGPHPPPPPPFLIRLRKFYSKVLQVLDGLAGVPVHQVEAWLDLELGEGIVVFHSSKLIIISKYRKRHLKWVKKHTFMTMTPTNIDILKYCSAIIFDTGQKLTHIFRKLL